ncbi:MAG: hypothetical protein K0B05_01360 [Bacteroidales bacterium]|nr:hypothetical protein [Bacteroidales bacterium]
MILIIPLIGGIIFTGYRSSARKQEADQAKALSLLNAGLEAATTEDWESFRSQSDLRIRDVDTGITELTTKTEKREEKTDAPNGKKISNLEEQIKFMKARLENFGKSQRNWESFKRGFNNEMDVIEEALKKLTADIENNNETVIVRTGE